MIHALHLLWIPVAFIVGYLFDTMRWVGKRDREAWRMMRKDPPNWREKIIELHEER